MEVFLFNWAFWAVFILLFHTVVAITVTKDVLVVLVLAWVKDRVLAVVELVEGELLIHGHDLVIDDEHDLPALHIRPVNTVSHGNRFGPLASFLLLVWSLVNVFQVQVITIICLKLNLIVLSRVKLSYTIFLRRGCVFQDWGLLRRKWRSLIRPFQSGWFWF